MILQTEQEKGHRRPLGCAGIFELLFSFPVQEGSRCSFPFHSAFALSWNFPFSLADFVLSEHFLETLEKLTAASGRSWAPPTGLHKDCMRGHFPLDLLGSAVLASHCSCPSARPGMPGPACSARAGAVSVDLWSSMLCSGFSFVFYIVPLPPPPLPIFHVGVFEQCSQWFCRLSHNVLLSDPGYAFSAGTLPEGSRG